MSSNQGWFDAFRDNGGIFLYSTDNRTAAVEDVRNILIYTTFATLFIAFLIIFPGIRKEVRIEMHFLSRSLIVINIYLFFLFCCLLFTIFLRTPSCHHYYRLFVCLLL
ncbi:hypothetical protein B4U80_05082 [Leptotrombidium deliense]|uniref:Uncharacterized protein n=1 Tax=Leptotrombidium deliense TaxID=299467 RepID=A0A443SQQ7_9ACAR|nr:hypothetical protein B4U80_05082 [Leptotrombidium deliense]